MKVICPTRRSPTMNQTLQIYQTSKSQQDVSQDLEKYGRWSTRRKESWESGPESGSCKYPTSGKHLVSRSGEVFAPEDHSLRKCGKWHIETTYALDGRHAKAMARTFTTCKKQRHHHTTALSHEREKCGN